MKLKTLINRIKRTIITFQILWISDRLNHAVYLDLDKKHRDRETLYNLNIKKINLK